MPRKKSNPTTDEYAAAVDRWLDVDLDTMTDAQIGAAMDEVERTTPRPPVMPNPHDPPGGVLACPMPPSWRRWDLFGLTYRSDCPDGSDAVIAHARNLRRGETIRQVPLRWEIASDDASVKPLTTAEVGRETTGWAKDTPCHIHAEFVHAGHVVHLDVVAASRYGPGRSFVEARIFIDGQLAGRGGAGSCSLGGGGSDLPALALLDPSTLVVVTDRRTGWPQGYDAASQRPLVTLTGVVIPRSRARRVNRHARHP